jgi:hypothetical protein
MESLAMQKILSVEANQITKTLLEDMFASYHDKETNEFKQSNFVPTELITLTSNDYKWVDGKIETTTGMLLFNRYILERTGIIEHLGYWNRPIDKKGLESLTAEVNNLAILDKITIEQLGQYIDSRDRLGFWCASFLSVSITPSLIRPMDNVNKRKAELFKQYEKEINSDNPVLQTMTVNKIEKELMGMVRENLKSDSGYDLYRSGDGNLDNNYKTINVMRGSVFNNATKKYDVVESSLMDGVKKKDITPFANSVLAAAYPSAVGTADAGYMAKIILALLQSEHIDPNPDSDCGTTKTIPLTITKKNTKYVLYRYINDNGKKVLTDLHNINNYIGKTVQLYSPQCCERDAICGKCAGRLFHNLGVTNVGLLTTQVTQKLLNLKLKSKHDLSQNAGIVPEEYVFLHPNKYYAVEDGNLVNKIKLKLFIPRLLEELDGFVREPTNLSCMGIFPVKFYDKNDEEIFKTEMIIPSVLNFNIYNDIQEDPDNYIVSYEPGSVICSLGMQKSAINVEFFINQIYLYSKSPQVPYNLMTELMFRCLEINGVDLTGPSITYELLARRVCRHGDKSFATVYGTKPDVDPLGYDKLPFRAAVQQAGILQGVIFQDISKSLQVGLAQTLNGKKPTATPIEKIIKA